MPRCPPAPKRYGVPGGRPSGQSLQDIAKRCGYSAYYLSRLLSGERVPTWPLTEKFARACGADPALRKVWETERLRDKTPVPLAVPVSPAPAGGAAAPPPRDELLTALHTLHARGMPMAYEIAVAGLWRLTPDRVTELLDGAVTEVGGPPTAPLHPRRGSELLPPVVEAARTTTAVQLYSRVKLAVIRSAGPPTLSGRCARTRRTGGGRPCPLRAARHVAADQGDTKQDDGLLLSRSHPSAAGGRPRSNPALKGRPARRVMSTWCGHTEVHMRTSVLLIMRRNVLPFCREVCDV
ncbi:helix-turn-helix domain-containing protein [Kitasatospora aburaviensis]